MSTLFKRRHIREVAPEVIPPGHVRPDAEDIDVPAARPTEEPLAVEKTPDKAPPALEPVPREVEPHHYREAAPKVVPAGQTPDEAREDDWLGEEQPQPALEPVPRTIGPHHYLVCEIRFWRGWRKGMFYAGMQEDGEEVAVAESAAFPLAGRDPDPARTDEAVAAYDELRAALEAGGWEHVAPGATWYAGTWRRATDAEGPGQARTPL